MVKGIWAAILLLTSLIGDAAVAAPAVESPIEQAVSNARRSEADRERDKTSEPVAVLGFFGLKPGMQVLDLFSGGGYYSEIVSHAVGPAGEVVAHVNDIYEKYNRDEITERYQGGRLPNVRLLVSNPPELKLPHEAFDMVLMVMTYHDIYYVSESNPRHPEIDRDRFFAQLYRCLKSGGILAIVDHAAKPGTGKEAAQGLHRIDEKFARKDIEAAGFVFDGELEVLRNPADERTMSVFDDRIRRRTDRFVFRFIKGKARD